MVTGVIYAGFAPWWLVSYMHDTSHHGDWCRMHSVLVAMVTGVIYAWHQSPWWQKQNVMAFCHHCQWWLNAMAFCHHCQKQNALVPVHSVFVYGDWMPWHSVLITMVTGVIYAGFANGDWCHAFCFCLKQNGVMAFCFCHHGDWCHICMAPVTMVTGVIYAWHQSPWWLKQNAMAPICFSQ